MAHVIPDALDAALTYLKTNATALVACSAHPTTYAEAVGSMKLASKASPTIGSIGDGASPGGRKFEIAAFSAAAGVTATGKAKFWALVDGSNSDLLLVQDCVPVRDLVLGTDFVLEEAIAVEMAGLSA